MRPDLLALAASLSARGERFALVTVVRREPPSSARVGDTALITHGGDYHGWAGGGWFMSSPGGMRALPLSSAAKERPLFRG